MHQISAVLLPRLGKATVLSASLFVSACQLGSHWPTLQSAPSKAGSYRGGNLASNYSATSGLIEDLAKRASVLPEASSYGRIAQIVLSASPGVEAAELGLARLRAKAANANRWPSISPVLTLDSLADLAAQVVMEQPLLDNGYRQAERDRAAAEVDLAAVKLATHQNARVFDGLSLYLTAEQARIQGQIAEAASLRLATLQGIVNDRVAGGLSDRSEAQIVAQTAAEMQATLATDAQIRSQALAGIAALANTLPPADLIGTSPLATVPRAEALSVLRSVAEGARMKAEARIARAGALPGISANVRVNRYEADPELRLGGVRIGLGSDAVVAAAEAVPDFVARQIMEARNAAERRRIELEGRLDVLRSNQREGAEVLRRTLENLDLFTDQYRMGRRSLTDLTGQTAAAANLERSHAALAFEIARLELELARDAGVLVDGGRL